MDETGHLTMLRVSLQLARKTAYFDLLKAHGCVDGVQDQS